MMEKIDVVFLRSPEHKQVMFRKICLSFSVRLRCRSTAQTGRPTSIQFFIFLKK